MTTFTAIIKFLPESLMHYKTNRTCTDELNSRIYPCLIKTYTECEDKKRPKKDKYPIPTPWKHLFNL